VSSRFDQEVLQLIPHRPPMLLINQLVEVDEKHSEALVVIDSHTPFFQPALGVPAWIGLEYMGQTAALIGGYQQSRGTGKPQMGFLMGARNYQSSVQNFTEGETLRVVCQEAAQLGESLATFNCTISAVSSNENMASGILSVFRKPLD